MFQPLSQEILSSSEGLIAEVPEQNAVEVEPVPEVAEQTIIEGVKINDK